MNDYRDPSLLLKYKITVKIITRNCSRRELNALSMRESVFKTSNTKQVKMFPACNESFTVLSIDAFRRRLVEVRTV